MAPRPLRSSRVQSSARYHRPAASLSVLREEEDVYGADARGARGVGARRVFRASVVPDALRNRRGNNVGCCCEKLRKFSRGDAFRLDENCDSLPYPNGDKLTWRYEYQYLYCSTQEQVSKEARCTTARGRHTFPATHER